MRILIAAVGRLKDGPERELAEAYRKRGAAVGRTLGWRDVEIVEVRESRAREVERRRTEESIAIANLIPDGAVAVILDENGHGFDSAGFAKQLSQWRAEDKPAVCFIIGGADGLAASLRQQTKLILAFGTATWPHQLIRVMLLEQIYRAGTILTGHPYHRI